MIGSSIIVVINKYMITGLGSVWLVSFDRPESINRHEQLI